MSDDKGATIVIRRVRKVSGGGHHGGAWKVAYADFVTAMMAFFLVMWLVGSTTNKQKAAISEYFKNPSALPGKSVSPAAGPNGPGGASVSMIKLGGAVDIPHGNGNDQLNRRQRDAHDLTDDPQRRAARQDAAAAAAEGADHKRLESLLDELKAALDKSQALEPFKDQLLIDIMSEGLRIQIVDKQNRPMFDLGSASLKPYTAAILRELAHYINSVPNRISITGHTDLKPFPSTNGYTNWELSADRANAARRALVAGGMDAGKVVRVVGLASSVLFDKQNPYDPINRRISIIVMTHQAELDALSGGNVDKRVDAGDKLSPDSLKAAASGAAPAAAASTPATQAAATQAAASVQAPASPRPATKPQTAGVALPPLPSLAAAAAAQSAGASVAR
jgi:chemotaxis protein MotB